MTLNFLALAFTNLSSNSSTASVNRPAAISLAPQVIQALNDKPPFCHIKREIIGHHRTIASASLRRLFAPLLPFKKAEIHTGFLRFPNFELGQKSCLRLLAELRGGAIVLLHLPFLL